MPYKVIVVCVENSSSFDACIDTAVRIAVQNHAHLVGAVVVGAASLEVDCSVPALLDRFQAKVRDLKLASYESRLIDGDAAIEFSRLGRFSDLVILGREGAVSGIQRADFLEYVVLNCGSPVLVVPPVSAQAGLWDNVLVAWDNGMPASRALRSSLPFLRRAQRVDLVHFQSPMETKEMRQESMADLVKYLHWHGIKGNPVCRPSDGNIGSDMVGLANEFSAGLIVMGCVAHPRYPGVHLGGATRTILESTPIPVLMSR